MLCLTKTLSIAVASIRSIRNDLRTSSGTIKLVNCINPYLPDKDMFTLINNITPKIPLDIVLLAFFLF